MHFSAHVRETQLMELGKKWTVFCFVLLQRSFGDEVSHMRVLKWFDGNWTLIIFDHELFKWKKEIYSIEVSVPKRKTHFFSIFLNVFNPFQIYWNRKIAKRQSSKSQSSIFECQLMSTSMNSVIFVLFLYNTLKVLVRGLYFISKYSIPKTFDYNTCQLWCSKCFGLKLNMLPKTDANLCATIFPLTS